MTSPRCPHWNECHCGVPDGPAQLTRCGHEDCPQCNGATAPEPVPSAKDIALANTFWNNEGDDRFALPLLFAKIRAEERERFERSPDAIRAMLDRERAKSVALRDVLLEDLSEAKQRAQAWRKAAGRLRGLLVDLVSKFLFDSGSARAETEGEIRRALQMTASDGRPADEDMPQMVRVHPSHDPDGEPAPRSHGFQVIYRERASSWVSCDVAGLTHEQAANLPFDEVVDQLRPHAPKGAITGYVTRRSCPLGRE
jgi:hypothetical protein